MKQRESECTSYIFNESIESIQSKKE